MIVADLAKAILAKIDDQIAQTIFIEKRTAFVFAEPEVSAFLAGFNVFVKTLSDFTVIGTEIGEGIIVNVNFPADAAAVPAFPMPWSPEN